MASPTQFEDASISKLMAGALLMDGECSDPFPWDDASNSTTSPNSTKLDRNEHFPRNIDGWQLHNPTTNLPPRQPQTTDLSQTYQHFVPTNSSRFDHMTNGNINNGCGQMNCDGLYKSPQDQLRHKYGTYSNEKYPDFNISLKTETTDFKWSPCARTHNAAIEFYEKMSGTQSSPLDEAYSPKSFTSKDTNSDDSPSPCINVPNTSMGNFIKTEPDVKTNGHDENWPDCSGGGSGGGGNVAPPSNSIDVDHMINSGVTIAGYKPRKIICKRKKSTVPTDLKDTGYWEKRKKNNDSARRSREAKKEKERNFYKRALHLEYENHYLKERVAYLETKLNALTQQNPNHFPCSDTQPVI